MTFARLCPHNELKHHVLDFGFGAYCPGGVVLDPEQTIVIEDRGDAVEQIGLITTDPRWSHVESPLLLEFALTVLDALAAAKEGKET